MYTCEIHNLYLRKKNEYTYLHDYFAMKTLSPEVLSRSIRTKDSKLTYLKYISNRHNQPYLILFESKSNQKCILSFDPRTFIYQSFEIEISKKEIRVFYRKLQFYGIKFETV